MSNNFFVLNAQTALPWMKTSTLLFHHCKLAKLTQDFFPPFKVYPVVQLNS